MFVHRELGAVGHVDPAALGGGAGPGGPRPGAAPGESLLLSPPLSLAVRLGLRAGGSPLLAASSQVVEAPDQEGHVLSLDETVGLDLLPLCVHSDDVVHGGLGHAGQTAAGLSSEVLTEQSAQMSLSCSFSITTLDSIT